MYCLLLWFQPHKWPDCQPLSSLVHSFFNILKQFCIDNVEDKRNDFKTSAIWLFARKSSNEKLLKENCIDSQEIIR